MVLPRLMAVKNPPASARDGREHGFNPWVGKDPLEEA